MHGRTQRVATEPVDGSYESSWIAEVRAGDASALEAIYLAYAPGLLVYAGRCLGSADAADDVVHDVFLAFWQGRARLDIRERLRVYLYRAVRNRVLNLHRHERVVQRSGPAIIRELVAQEEEIQRDEMMEQEIAERLEAGIAALPPRSREVLLMHRQRGLTYPQIASTLGLSVKTVEAHMTRALRGLREQLSRLRQR